MTSMSNGVPTENRGYPAPPRRDPARPLPGASFYFAEAVQMAAYERRLVACLAAVLVAFPVIRTAALFSTETQADASFASGSALLQIVFGAVFALSAVLLWLHGERALNLLPRLNPFLLLLVAWCACTVLWSPYPVVTLKRVVQFAGLIITGMALCLPHDFPARFRLAALAALTGLLVTSFLVALAIPAIGVDGVRGYAWRGIFWHKNTLGAGASICLLFWVDALCQRLLPARAGWVAIPFVLLMLVMAKSSTALLTATLGCTVYLVAFARQRLMPPHALTVAWLALAAAAALGLHVFFLLHGRLPALNELAVPVAALVGKNPDLTGRTELWHLVMLQAALHPLQGLGYGAFWLNLGSPSQYIIDAVGWVPLQAHNGYVDIFNELGLIGIALVLLLLCWHGFQLLRLSRLAPREAALYWAILAIILVSNFSESQLFNGVQFQNSLFIMSSTMLAASVRRETARRAAAVALARTLVTVGRS